MGATGFEKWMQPFLLCTAAAKGDLEKVCLGKEKYEKGNMEKDESVIIT
jgi:hypothetical protein